LLVRARRIYLSTMGCVTSCTVMGMEAQMSTPKVKQIRFKEPAKPFHEEYILKNKLGKGSFAQVHLATGVNHGTEVAVKITDMRAAKDGDKCDIVDHRTRSAVLSEVAVMRRVGTQPHCVAFYEEYFEGFLSYIVMERCDMTLLQALESAPALTERTLVRIIKEMLQALDSIHKLHVVHRDIKPDNFLCSGEERTVKLCDFGLAAVLPRQGELSGVFGTAPFMCPEMLWGEGYGTKADIWSVGVLTYVLLCGQFPYQPLDMSGKAMKHAIAVGTPKPTFKPKANSDMAGSRPFSHGALTFLRLMLDRNEVHRPSAADAMKLNWFAPVDDAQWSKQSLWPTLNAAKRVGAFETRAPKEDLKQGSLDVMLAAMQAKHHNVDAKHTRDIMEVPTSDTLESPCARTRDPAMVSTASSVESWPSIESKLPTPEANHAP